MYSRRLPQVGMSFVVLLSLAAQRSFQVQICCRFSLQAGNFAVRIPKKARIGSGGCSMEMRRARCTDQAMKIIKVPQTRRTRSLESRCMSKSPTFSRATVVANGNGPSAHRASEQRPDTEPRSAEAVRLQEIVGHINALSHASYARLSNRQLREQGQRWQK